jgi:serine/threonine protein kinase/tetratricopeptide (TPR) repeat protein
VGSPDAAALLSLAESIADGAPIDWVAAEERATAGDHAVIRQLRILSDVAGLHRSLLPDAVPAPQSARQAPAQAIGTWAHLALIERLGGGTFGEVYRAWDRHLEREVALKLLRMDETVDDLHASRIAMEGRLIARVRHPNVITVHGVDAHDQRVGLWMELVRGVTLEHQLAAHGPLSAREAALVGIDLCRALAAIHAAGLIHRDVKAQNVMREDGGRIVLMDLGTGREIGALARTTTPDLAGTPLYLAPEIFSGAAASERTDLYSLGVLLYHLVTGAFPVRTATMQELLEAHKKGLRVRLRDARADLPATFVRVIDRAIATDPEDRYATAGTFEAALGEELAEAPTKPASPVPQALIEQTPSRSSPWRLRPVLGVAVMALLALAVVLWFPIRRWLAATETPAAGFPGHVSMLAVLPFENLSADPGEAYLANSVPMELTARLGQVGALKVVPWTFMRQFGARGRASLKEVADRTGADAVIEGAVQLVPGGSDGKRPVQVRVQVYQASTGGLLWSGSFERSLGDFFALQAEIAQEITSRVHVVLAAREQALVLRSRRVPAQAMEDYLTGRQLQKVQMDIHGASEAFLRAIRAAPGFAEAYVALSLCHTLGSAYYSSVPSTVALSRALDASNRAIELDAGLPEAWAARGFARFALEGNWTAAESDFQRALQLGPESVDVLASYSNFLTDRGRHDQAIEVSRKAEERAPFSAAASRQVAWAYYMAREFDNAIRQARRALAIEPGYVPARTVLARGLLFRGRFAEGISELESMGPEYEWVLAVGYAMAGRRDDAERLINQMLSPASDRPVVAYHIALAYVALHDEARAMEWLERALRDGDASLTELSVDPMLDPIRPNPLFQSLAARVDQRH